MFSVFFLCHIEPCIAVSVVSLQYCTSKMKGLVVVSVWVYQKKKSGLIPVQVSWVHIRLVYSGQTVYVFVSGSAGQCSRGSDCHCLCNSVCRSSGKELMMVWMDCSNLSRSSSFTGSWCFLALICIGHIERSFMHMS